MDIDTHAQRFWKGPERSRDRAPLVIVDGAYRLADSGSRPRRNPARHHPQNGANRRCTGRSGQHDGDTAAVFDLNFRNSVVVARWAARTATSSAGKMRHTALVRLTPNDISSAALIISAASAALSGWSAFTNRNRILFDAKLAGEAVQQLHITVFNVGGRPEVVKLRYLDIRPHGRPFGSRAEGAFTHFWDGNDEPIVLAAGTSKTWITKILTADYIQSLTTTHSGSWLVYVGVAVGKRNSRIRVRDDWDFSGSLPSRTSHR